MKVIWILLFLISLPAGAVDTSGCSPMLEAQHQVVTAHGAELSVSSFKAPRANCWNCADSYVHVHYTWRTSVAKESPVDFWIKINGQASQLKVIRKCSYATDGGTTSGVPLYECVAEFGVTIGTLDAWTIEVAPQVDGVWDTYGMNQNYEFSL